VGDVGRTFPRKDWPKAIVIEDNCIGSGCELCIAVCPFDALELDVSGGKVGDFFGIASVIERRCTGCRLCEQSCGWSAIYIDPPREMQKKLVWPDEEGEEPAKPEAAPAQA
jgi:ferredoxin